MKALLVASLLALAGCIVYDRSAFESQPFADAPPTSAQTVPARRAIAERQAVDVAFRLCADRGLRVDRLERAQLDASGRWHVTLTGNGDRAQMLLDGRDGKLLKGRFKQASASPAAPPPGPSAQPPAGAPPPPPAEGAAPAPQDELD
jgi:acetolactate synthase regulatory subunit